MYAYGCNPQIDRHLAPVQRPAPQAALSQLVCTMCQDSRDNTLPPQDALPLITALNRCVARVDRFPERASACSIELLTHLLDQLDVMPGQLTTHLERGSCGRCNQVFEQVSFMI